MARRKARRTYEPEDNADNEFDDSFVVSGEETFYIDDKEIIVEDAIHAIKDGQEYVIIDNQLYPVDQSGEDSDEYYTTAQQYEQPAASSSWLGILGIIIVAATVGVIITLFAGPFIIGFASGISDPDNTNIISPNIRSENNLIPEIPKVDSKEKQTAAKIKNAMDYTNPITRDFALTLIPNTHDGNYNIAQICDLWEAVDKKWTYVNDPKGSDYYSPASRTIQLGLKGDCDDFAIIVGSLVQSIGGSTRIVTAYNAEGGHAYPEVYIGNSKASVDKVASYISKRYHTTGIAYHTRTKDGVTQYWLNLDWQSRFPGGNYYHKTGEMTIYYPNGYWYQSG